MVQVAELGNPHYSSHRSPRKSDVVVVAGPAVSCSHSGQASLSKIKVRACAAVNVNDQYKMQDPNHWYSLQRSNTGQHAYSVQDSASNTPSLPPAGLHDNQAQSSVYSFASAVRPTQGESFSPSLDTNYSPYIPQRPVTFPIYPWSHIRLHMHNPNISTRIAVNLLHLIPPHTRSMRLS